MTVNFTRSKLVNRLLFGAYFSKGDPNKKANAGKVNINTQEINFGNFTGETNRTLKLSNSGNSVLNIRNIQSSSPWVTPSKTALVINPGEIVDIKVNIDNSTLTD